jgi:hypothetical protein
MNEREENSLKLFTFHKSFIGRKAYEASIRTFAGPFAKAWGSWCLDSWILLVLVWSLGGCNSKREEPPLPKLKDAESRSQDYRKSYFFEQKVTELSRRLKAWNQGLSQIVDRQGPADKPVILGDSLDSILPLLQQSQRGFFKKTSNSWYKEVNHIEKLTGDKELFLEKITVKIVEDVSNKDGTALALKRSGQTRGDKDFSWELVASGRSPKDPSTELFKLKWDSTLRRLRIDSLQKTETPFSCEFNLNEVGHLEFATCLNFVFARTQSKDIHVDRLSYNNKLGFQGEGKVTNGKGQSEKWELQPSTSSLSLPPRGGE